MGRRYLSLLLLALLPFATAGAAIGDPVSMQQNDRAMTRAWAQWWHMSTSRSSPFWSPAGADRSFERGHFNIARKRYLVMAAYGDKFAQFRLGLIALDRNDPISAWSWFTLANEDGSEPAFAPYPDMVWEELSISQRRAAQAHLEQRIGKYSDYGLAERMHRLFRQRLRMTTGSRLGFTGYLLSLTNSGIPSSIDAMNFYDNLSRGLKETERLLDNYGTVELGELEVVEDN